MYIGIGPVSSLVSRMPLLVAALWWASLTTIGFLVVPLLFVHLPTPAIAGAMAARLFSAQTWVSTACGLLLLLLASRQNRNPSAASGVPAGMMFVLGAMLLALLSEFAVAPRIVLRENLRLWHSLGSAMFVLQWLCTLIVFWKLAGTSGRQAQS